MLRKSLLLNILSVLLATFLTAGEFTEWCGENLGPATDREGKVSELIDVDFLWILEMDRKSLLYITFGPRDDENPAFEPQSIVTLVASKREGEGIVFHSVEKETEGTEGLEFPFDDLRACDHSQSSDFVYFKETIQLIKNPKFHQCLEKDHWIASALHSLGISLM